MQLIADIKTTKTKSSRIQYNNLQNPRFGEEVSDHMLICDFDNGKWNIPEILPYANLTMSPTALALHYGQTVFEGMKAFRRKDGRINIFRIDKHYERLVKSLDRMCMPIIPKEIFVEGIVKLVKLDCEWVSSEAGSSLYIRPFMYASEGKFGIHVSEEYRFVIFTGPVGLYYSKPLKVKVETQFIRAAKGGTGYAKCGGNYGGALYPTQMAHKEGYDQVLWTDAMCHKYIEESGTMNVMFVVDGVLITPPISDSILDGVTRDSLLTIAKDLGVSTQVRPISIDQLRTALVEHTLSEAFGVGTAAVIAPISLINIEGTDYPVNNYSGESISTKLKEYLEGLRIGIHEDVYGWSSII